MYGLGVAQVCSKEGVKWMWSPKDGNLSGICFKGYIPVDARVIQVQTLIT